MIYLVMSDLFTTEDSGFIWICAFTAVQSLLIALFHVNHPCSFREEHPIKEPCGLSGIMGYVTFHHKTRRGPHIVSRLHEKQPLSCFSQPRNTKWHITQR